MVEITHREKTEEEIKAIEEARKTHGKWMGEERVADIFLAIIPLFPTPHKITFD